MQMKFPVLLLIGLALLPRAAAQDESSDSETKPDPKRIINRSMNFLRER